MPKFPRLASNRDVQRALPTADEDRSLAHLVQVDELSNRAERGVLELVHAAVLFYHAVKDLNCLSFGRTPVEYAYLVSPAYTQYDVKLVVVFVSLSQSGEQHLKSHAVPLARSCRRSSVRRACPRSAECRAKRRGRRGRLLVRSSCGLVAPIARQPACPDWKRTSKTTQSTTTMLPRQYSANVENEEQSRRCSL